MADTAKIALSKHPNLSAKGEPEYLGKGSFGYVFKAYDSQHGEVAVKLVPVSSVRGNLRHFLAEVINHRQLSGHAHIIEFKYVFSLDDFVGIVMEYANKKSLVEFVQYTLPRVKDREALVRWYFQQLMLAVDYCHSHGIVNRDMKLDNTLLSTAPSMRSQFPLLKICDFGFSKKADISPPKTNGLGTYPYMAPELLMRDNAGTGYQPYDGKAVDVWSCGIILYLLMFGDFPFGKFKDEERQAALQRMMSSTYSLKNAKTTVSEGFTNLLQKMLNPYPDKRITVPDILKNEWFQQGLTAAHIEYNKKVLGSSERARKRRQPGTEIIQEMVKAVGRECLQEALTEQYLTRLMAT